MTRKQSFLGDERAIEGLPIRLVIALVVGVASLAIMMQLLGGIGSVGQTEAQVNLDNEIVTTQSMSSSSTPATVTVSAVSEDGDEITNGQMIVKSGSLDLENEPVALSTKGANAGPHQVEFTVKAASNCGSSPSATTLCVDFRSDQDTGTLTINLEPPSDSNYKDKNDNSEIKVVK
ncbi:hypothetical protein ACOZ4N_10760 [Halorientalis pallida]|uniref:DUF7382 domain-containing protein n=1 Tax=Halorientalis pallida TaxID=2479928 RepID=UPI003C705851